MTMTVKLSSEQRNCSLTDLSTLKVSPFVIRFLCHTVSYGCLSHGLTVASSLLTVLQILRGFSQTHSFYENKHRQHIQILLKDTFLVWLTKTKQEIAVLLLLSWALLFIILVKTHMENPFQCKQLSDSLKIAKICTTKYNRQLSSK